MTAIKKNEQLLKDFYSAFQNKDAQAMTILYHEQVQFSDPAFGPLNYAEVSLMWKMLCYTSKDLRVEYHIQEVSETSALIHWEAFYTYGKNKRKVHNKVKATMKFKDSKIIQHDDVFSLWKWASQAMGSTGLIVGWTSFFKKRLHQQTSDMLQRFLDKQKK